MNEKDQIDSASWLLVCVGIGLFFLAFTVHSFVPILFIVPLALILRKKKPEQYYVPSSHEQRTSTSSVTYPEAAPKEVHPSEYEYPTAQYPEQMPPMMQ